MFDFDTRIPRTGTGAIKWDRYKTKDVLPMWVADMDFRSPPAVIEALEKRIEHGVFGYTIAPDELTSVVLERLLRLYNWQVQPEWLVWLPGLVSGLNVICRAVGEPGNSVLTTVPIYPPFLSAPQNQHRQLQTCRMQLQGERWEIDWQELETSIDSSTSLFILCNPHNPLGRMFAEQELRQLAEICERHNLIICSDEIHCDLLLDQTKQHIPTATLSTEIADRTITLMAPSKTFNIAGLGLSFAIIPKAELRKKFEAAKMGIVPYPNALGYTAALAAYQDGQPWLDELLNYLRVNERLVYERVNSMPCVSTTPVEATYLAWIDAREVAENPYQFFLKHGIAFSDGNEFDGDGYVRLNFGCPRSMLEEVLERMEQALNDK